MYLLLKIFKIIFCLFYFFINIITHKRNQLELAQGKIKTYWNYIRLSHGIQKKTPQKTTELPTRPLERQKTGKEALGTLTTAAHDLQFGILPLT